MSLYVTSTRDQRAIKRATVIYLAAQGKTNEEIIAAIGFHRDVVTRWSTRPTTEELRSYGRLSILTQPVKEQIN